MLTIKYGGPAEIVDEEVGYAIPPTGGASAVTAALEDHLSDIFEHPEIWRQRGIIGRQRAERFYGWESKMEQILAIYQEILETQRL